MLKATLHPRAVSKSSPTTILVSYTNLYTINSIKFNLHSNFSSSLRQRTRGNGRGYRGFILRHLDIGVIFHSITRDEQIPLLTNSLALPFSTVIT